MRLVASAVTILLLLGLLTCLLVRGTDTHAPQYEQTLQAFDDFALGEASLLRDVLQARAGLLRDYDPLTRDIDAMEGAVARMRTHAQAEGLDAGPIDRLAASVARQDELTERFKSSNAVLQNSLSYVGLLSASPPFAAQDARLASAGDAVAAAILLVARDASPDALQALRERIDAFAAQVPAVGPDAEAAEALLAHARLLLALLPAIDETLRALVAAPSRRPLEQVRALFAAHQAAVESTAHNYRVLLYVTSLALLIMLARLGMQLRTRALAQSRRAAFERVIAENSTRLINCPPAETEARIVHVLGAYGRAMNVDRAYVVLDEKPVRVFVWSADHAPYPSGWPQAALTLPAQLSEVRLNIVVLPDVAALPPSDAKATLAAVGARSWACVFLSLPGGVRGIMGFDKFETAWRVVFPLPVVRLAGDVVANAIEREYLERDRARLATRLERSRRMQVIGSLASGIAHNFNNIIAAILGYSEMIEPELALGGKPAAHVEEIRRAAERGRDLVDSILTFGRQRDTRARPVQVRALLTEATALLRASLPENVALIVEDVAATIAVSGEPAQLQQVILNLCTNAAQAMDGGGPLRISATEKGLTTATVLSHGELSPGRYVCLAIADTGRGFDDTIARRLFEPFFTTRAGGTGLGLATVREIVRDHDGAMNVESKPAQGSRFEAWLPAASADAVTPTGPDDLPLGHGATVLIIESERERLLRSEEMLAALGYEPVGFLVAADAIAACRAAPNRFDALLISQAAAAEGLALARTLHKIVTTRPVILATVSTSDIRVDALAAAGISEVLRRPLVNTDLAAALARSLRSSTDRSGALQA